MQNSNDFEYLSKLKFFNIILIMYFEESSFDLRILIVLTKNIRNKYYFTKLRRLRIKHIVKLNTIIFMFIASFINNL